MNRYARQIQLPEIGEGGQASIGAARVLVVGAGGLGCPALQYLVGAGVGKICIVDPDEVSLSNLHRQTLYRENQINQPKAIVAAETLRTLNVSCEIEANVVALTPANANQFIADADIVLDCADSFAVSYILSDICFAQSIPLISASALSMEGYVGGFCGGAPSLRALFPDLPQRALNCATAGVMGPAVGTIGTMQAQFALNTLLKLKPSPLGQLINIDLHKLRTNGFRFDGADEPKDRLSFIDIEQITPQDFVIDLRGEDEAKTLVAPNASRITIDDFKNISPTPKNGQRAILTCRSGLRAWKAARILQTYWNGEISLISMGNTTQSLKG